MKFLDIKMGDRGRERTRSGSRSRGGNDRGDRSERGMPSEGTCSLLVRNISYRVRAEELRSAFARYGEVRDVYIPEASKHFLFVFNAYFI